MKYACLIGLFLYAIRAHLHNHHKLEPLSELTWTWHIAVADIKKVSRNLPIWNTVNILVLLPPQFSNLAGTLAYIPDANYDGKDQVQ